VAQLLQRFSAIRHDVDVHAPPPPTIGGEQQNGDKHNTLNRQAGKQRIVYLASKLYDLATEPWCDRGAG
jgi:hypothetical protein